MAEQQQKPVPKYMKFALGGSAGYVFFESIFLYFETVLQIPFYYVDAQSLAFIYTVNVLLVRTYQNIAT